MSTTQQQTPPASIVKIIQRRTCIQGWEYQVKWRNCRNEYTWMLESMLLTNVPGSRALLEAFKSSNRRTQMLPQASRPAGPPGKRRLTAQPEPPAETPSKRRHTSASSADGTPEYEQQQQQQQPRNQGKNQQRQNHQQRRRHPSSNRKKLEKRLQTSSKPRNKPKLHCSSKDIASASLQQRRPKDDACAFGPSGRVSTRKDELPPEFRMPMSSVELAHSLAQALSRKPQLTDSLVDAIAANQGDPDEQTKPLNKPDLQTLQMQMVRFTGRNHGVSNCDVDVLAKDLRRSDAAELDADLGEGWRLLHQAACIADRRAPDLLLALLEAGAAPDAVDASGFTPLMIAARTGNVASVSRLLQFGARLDARNAAGASALTLAMHSHRWDAAAVLLRHGAEFADLTSDREVEQLVPWTSRLSASLLNALRQTPGLSSVHLVGARPPHLAAVSPGGSRAFSFRELPTRDDPAKQRTVHLLVAGFVELDGLGGVCLRNLGRRPPPYRLQLNNRTLEPLASAGCLTVFPTAGALANPGSRNTLLLNFLPSCSTNTRLKLLMQPVCCLALRGPAPG